MVKAPVLTTEAFREHLAFFDQTVYATNMTLVTGYGLVRKDSQRTAFEVISEDYFGLIHTVNIDFMKYSKMPTEVYIWMRLTPLADDKFMAPKAPCSVQIERTVEGELIPIFRRSVDTRAPIKPQLEGFMHEAHRFYLAYCPHISLL